MRKTKTKGSKKGRVARNPPGLNGHLRQLTDQLQVAFTLRFVTTGTFSGNFGVTFQNLLDAWFIAGTATTAYELFDFVRVRRVTVITSPPATTGSAPMLTVGVEYFGLNIGNLGSGRQASDTAVGVNGVARVSLAPDSKSQAAQWQSSTTNSAFAVRATDVNQAAVAGTIIEVDVEYKNSADVNPAALGTARSGLTPGHLYFGGLDGLALANTQARSVFVPRA